MTAPLGTPALLPRRPTRRRWPWVLAAVVVVLFLMRGPLLAPLVRQVVAEQLAHALDGEVTVEAAGGGWFTDAHLSGVSVVAPLGTVRHLHLDEISATYGLALFGGELGSLRTLRVSGLEATIDLRGGDGASGVIPPLLELLPAPLPQVSLGGEVRLLLAHSEVLLSDLRLELAGDSVMLTTTVQVGANAPQPLSARFKRPSADTLRLVDAVTFGDATIDVLTVVLGRTRQELGATLRLGGGTLQVQAGPARIAITAEDVDLASVPASLLTLAPVELGRPTGTLVGELTALRVERGWSIAGSLHASSVTLAGLGPFALSAQGHLGAGSVQLPHVVLSGPDGGNITITNLALALADRRPLSGDLQVQIPDLRHWLPTNLALPPTVIALAAELAVDGDTLAIRQAKVTGGGMSGVLRGSLAAHPLRIEAGYLALEADLAPLQSLLRGTPNLAGHVQARLSGTLPLVSDLGAWLAGGLALDLRGDDLTVWALPVTSVRLVARSDGGRVQVTRAEATIAGIAVATAGSLAPNDSACKAQVERLMVTFPTASVSTTAPFPLLIGADRVSTGIIHLTSDAGDGTLELRHAQGLGLLHVAVPRLDLGRLGLPEASGVAELRIDLSGDWSAPLGTVTVGAQDLVLVGRHAQVDLDLSQTQQGVIIRRGHINAGADGQLTLAGTLPCQVGTRGIVALPDDGKPATVTLDVAALERWLPRALTAGAAHLALDLGAGNDPTVVVGTLRVSGVRPQATGTTALQRVAATTEMAGELAITADTAGLALTLAGTADGQPAYSGELRSAGAWDPATLAASWRQRPLLGKLTLAQLDLARFASLVPQLLHLSGQAHGALQVSGTLGEPQFSGELALEALELKVAPLVPTIANGHARLLLTGSHVQLADGVVDLGGEPLTIDGTLELTPMPRADLRLAGRNVLLVQRHDARLRADLDLTLVGALDALTLSGTAVVTNALFTPDVSLFSGGGGNTGDGRLVPFEFNEPPMSTMRFAVAVRSAFGKGRDGIRLATSLVRADCDLDLMLRGTGAAPELAGRVTVRSGNVFLPFSTLKLSTGEIGFPDGDPFHPRLHAVATSQVRRWTITLEADGPLADPQIRASGTGLDERDALLLLTAGATSSELSGEAGQHAALGRLGTWLGVEAWDALSGEADPDAGPSLLDRVTLEFGREVSDTGNDTIKAEVEVTDPELVPGVLIYGERDRWDDYNAGVILRFRWGGEE